MKVFLTGIITTPYAREFLSKCAAVLRANGFDCYTPGDGWEPGSGDQAESTVEGDYAALEQADVLLAILDGYNVNDGIAGHIGTFYALTKQDASKKGILGILHDTRVARWDWGAGAAALNYYVLGCVQERGHIYRSFADALSELLRWTGQPANPGQLEAGLA